jgi:hypothetical protein
MYAMQVKRRNAGLFKEGERVCKIIVDSKKLGCYKVIFFF